MWSVTGYGTINIVLAGTDHIHLASEFDGTSGGFVASVAGGAVTINIKGALVDGTDVQEMHFGAVHDVTFGSGAYDSFGFLTSEASSGVTTFGGKIVDTAKVFLELGVTDAVSIDASTAHGLDMEDPGSAIGNLFTVVGSTGTWNSIQGTFGLLLFEGQDDSAFGFGGSFSFTGGSHGDEFWTTGGTGTINLAASLAAGHSDTINFNIITLNSGGFFHPIGITDSGGDFSDANAGAGVGTTTVTNFVVGGANPDLVNFSLDSWNTGAGYNGLIEGDGATATPGPAHEFNVSTSGQTLNTNTDLVVYTPPGTFTKASLATALNSSGGSFSLNALPNDGDLLILYNTANGSALADLHLFAANGTSTHDNVTAADLHVLMNFVGVSAQAFYAEYLAVTPNPNFHFFG